MALLRAAELRHADRLAALERKMMAFYASASDYFASPEAGADNRFYEGLRLLIDRYLPGPLKVLEVGAGKTAFPSWLRRLPVEVTVAAQDVTPINEAHLRRVADEVFIGPLDAQPIDGRFDLVVSSFVYEHVVHPQRFLDRCLAALRPGGLLVIFSPKYTVPFYVPPALRARPWLTRHGLTLRLMLAGLMTRLSRRPKFQIVEDPALLSGGPFFRDSDAVHLVQPIDAKLYLRGRAEVVPLRVRALSAKDWIWQRLAFNKQAFRRLPLQT